MCCAKTRLLASYDDHRSTSAQRHRELDRLNQIERRRQFLELKRQNDLFDHMSDTVNGLDKDETISSAKEAGYPSATCLNQHDERNTHASSGLKDSINPTESEATPKTTSKEIANHPQQAHSGSLGGGTSKPDSLDELRLTSLSLPEKRFRNGKAIDSDEAQVQGAQVSIKARAIQIHEQQQQLTKSGDVPDNKSSDNFVKRPITSEHLARFVSNRVPENKRVLCLIVRDKLSKLNKAKSYFYPTYYLFIQAIVDIDDVLVCEQGPDQAATTTGDGDNNLPGIHSGIGNRNITNITSTSADNSFSASSSISADMLFIGVNGENGTNMSSMKMLSGNSYSDNEAYAGTETEDDNSTSVKTTTTKLPKQVRIKSGFIMKSAGSLQGRDSPLVFPNRDNNNNCDTSESGSLIGAWSSASKDMVNMPSDKRAITQTASSTTATTVLSHQSSGSKGGKLVISSGVKELNQTSSKSGSLGTAVDESTLNKGKTLMKMAGKLSIEDSKEDGDDIDDDDDDDSDNDELNCKRWINAGKEEVNHNSTITTTATKADASNGAAFATATNISFNTDQENIQQSLFDNEKNPYTGTYGVLLAGRRRKKAKTYLIGLNEYGYTRKNSICKLKSNVLGTQFNAIRLNQADDTDRCNIASISYETNVLGFKGPRKMRVFLPKDPGRGTKNLAETFKKNPAAVVQLKNMTPSWNVESQSYVLNFHGRVTQASVKNFQLIESEMDYFGDGQRGLISQRDASMNEDAGRFTTGNLNPSPTQTHRQSFGQHQNGDELMDSRIVNAFPNSGTNQMDKNSVSTGNKGLTQYNSSIVMQFGRISNHEFTCDVTHPLSILQAFSIALSSFDSKLACE